MGAVTPLVTKFKICRIKEAKESQTCPSPITESSAEERIDSLYSLTKDELEACIKLAAQAQMHYKNNVVTAWRLGREQAGDNSIC